METPRWSRAFLPITSPIRASYGESPFIAGRRFGSRTTVGGSNACAWLLRRFDVNRLDHFIGFVRTYEVSAQDQTAVNGQYQPGGGASFFEAARLGAWGFCLLSRMISVPQRPKWWLCWINFRFRARACCNSSSVQHLESNSVSAERHSVRSVVYTGTHDNDTTAGWYREVAQPATRSLAERVGGKRRGDCLGHDPRGAGLPGRHSHRPRARPPGTGVGGTNEYARNRDRKLAMASERWRAEPGAHPKAAKPNFNVWAHQAW